MCSFNYNPEIMWKKHQVTLSLYSDITRKAGSKYMCNIGKV